MKQNLTALLVKPIVKDEDLDGEDKSARVDQEYEEIFKTMETVSDIRKVKRRKNTEETGEGVMKKKKKKMVP